ncbi:MAG TPA: hypothetical protein VL443_14080 [Cyclobacteriaceae bacterium]|nr:hypothetical protein [Cyclobacteriaceae bacterium]
MLNTNLYLLRSRFELTFKFLLFCLFYILTLKVSEYLLIDDELYFQSYSHLLNYNEINDLINNEHNNRWIYYLTTVVFFLLKFTILTLFILSAAFFFNKELDFKSVFRSFVEAEFLFLIPMLIKVLWFLFIQTDYTIPDISSFFPLSLSNLISLDEKNNNLIYILQTLNLFEVAYWFFLASRLSYNLNSDYKTGVSHVFTGYIPVLFLWFIMYTFIISLAT